MSKNNWIATIVMGDTSLDVYGYIEEAEEDVGFTGSVDIEDVCVEGTDVSVLEMILSFAEGSDRLQDYTCEAIDERGGFDGGDDDGYDD